MGYIRSYTCDQCGNKHLSPAFIAFSGADFAVGAPMSLALFCSNGCFFTFLSDAIGKQYSNTEAGVAPEIDLFVYDISEIYEGR